LLARKTVALESAPECFPLSDVLEVHRGSPEWDSQDGRFAPKAVVPGRFAATRMQTFAQVWSVQTSAAGGQSPFSFSGWNDPFAKGRRARGTQDIPEIDIDKVFELGVMLTARVLWEELGVGQAIRDCPARAALTAPHAHESPHFS
jgi:hypothetical protein